MHTFKDADPEVPREESSVPALEVMSGRYCTLLFGDFFSSNQIPVCRSKDEQLTFNLRTLEFLGDTENQTAILIILFTVQNKDQNPVPPGTRSVLQPQRRDPFSSNGK